MYTILSAIAMNEQHRVNASNPAATKNQRQPVLKLEERRNYSLPSTIRSATQITTNNSSK